MESAHQNPLEQLTSLVERHFSLGERLSQASQHLQKSGQPLPEVLLEELVKYNRDFSELQQQVLTDTTRSSTPISLHDLKRLVQRAVESPDETVARQPALNILSRVLTFEHRDQEEFPALAVAKTKARELQLLVSQNPPQQTSREIESLIAGNHPINALVTLVDQQDDLDDSQWVSLEEKVETGFGKPLAIAVSRGRIVSSHPSEIPSTGTSVATSTVIAAAASQQIPSNHPDIVILEEPGPSTSQQDVIIVPSVDLPKPTTKLDSPITSQVTSQNLAFGNVPLQNKAPIFPGMRPSVGLKVGVHLQGLGDREFQAQEYAGTRGQGRRLEAFRVNITPSIPDLSLQYGAHIAGIGDTPMVSEGEWVGERGRGRQIEGFVFKLTGAQAENYDVFYTAHVQNKGDIPVCSNGQYCGTRGQALRVEGMKVWIQAKKS